MLQTLSEHIAECFARADHAQRRADETRDPAIKANFDDIARRWIRLAESYQFVERVDRFLNETKRR